ncbi:helix-turn-helix domain-containing protein [Hymenobacter aquaticus]|uniref:Helix-turn-helix domain-containing protein n=1 Tax=Hymenobacter aquaticus TaxID=1867101 RepID=A0A4Z0Q301_9BACT|nr:helix-turn-helix transcriptional regulator [Hymenobacter aquaticus]TGE24417.1 helix-turn-helix domain-containing protein [Hymenobacter aquaticus]
MSRRVRASDSFIFRLRAWFGLRQDQLALYAGVSKATIQAVESGRRTAPSKMLLALRPLLMQLPPPTAPPTLTKRAAPLAAPLPMGTLPVGAGTPLPDAEELDFRRRVCLHQAAGLRMQTEKIEEQARVIARWAQALPALLEAHPAPTAEEIAADEDAVEHHTWLLGWLRRQARPLPAEEVTRWHLLQARMAALEAEAATLAARLPPAPATE